MRIQAKWKQEELAEKTALPRSVISAHETKRRTPSSYQIQKYNSVFECDITNFAPVKGREKMISRSIRISEDLHKDLMNEASKNEMELAQYIRLLLKKGIQEDYITKSMDTLVILIQEAIERIQKKDTQQNRQVPMLLLQSIFLTKYFMRDSLHMSSIELDEIVDNTKMMAREEFYRAKAKGDS